MRKYLVLLLFFFVSVCAVTQPATTTVPDETYGKGGTKTTTAKNDGLGTETTTEEFRDGSNPPKLRQKKVVIKNLVTGDSTVTYTYYYDSYGEIKSWEMVRTYTDGKITNSSSTDYHKNGGIKKETKSTLLPNGDLKVEKLNTKTGKYEEKIYKKEDLEPFDSLKYLPSSGNLLGMNQPREEICKPKIEIFGGYSYLRGDIGNDKESFPAGGHVAALYNIKPNLGLGLDASFHTKKDGDQTFSRSFLLAEGRYIFGDATNCNRKIIPDVHVLAGLGCEKFKYNSGTFSSTSKGSGFAYGGGVGLNLNINNKLAVRLFQADYILTRFDNESFGNFRASTGLVLRLGEQ